MPKHYCTFAIVGLLAAFLSTALPLYAQEPMYNDNPNNDTGSSQAGAAQLQVQLSQMEEEIHRMQGMIEQVTYENKQLKAQLDRSAGDIDFRLSALEKKTSQPAAATATAPATAANAAATAPATSENGVEIPAPADATKDDSAALKPTSGAATDATPTFTSPRDHYNYAFKVLQEAKYDEAGNLFTSFVQHYPKDPLVGNGYYWLGETFYVRRDYIHAADSFRQGYEAVPTGPKAPDNLLKLAMSLNALNKDKEACVVLKQIQKKFGGPSSSITPRVEREINRIGCN